MREVTLNLSSLRFPGPWKRKAVMAPKNVFSALLLSKDPLPLEAVRKVFEEYGIELQSAASAADLDHLVRARRFDLVLCDYDAPGAPQLSCLRNDTRWRGISMVILRDLRPREIKGKRIHFTVSKPLNADVLSKGLRAAYTSMARERFASYRHVVALRPMAGTLLYRGGQRAIGQSVIANISQTGLCLSGPEPLPPGGIISVNFPLPDADRLLHVVGTIVWSDASGKAGVRFHSMTAQEQKQLKERLNAKLPWNADLLFPHD